MSWVEEHNSLCKEFEFEDFRMAFAFMTIIADIAEDHQHHPKMINEYNKVRFELCTHDAGNTITDKDVKLAEAIDLIYNS